MRGQAEVISTAIIVSVALVIALGLVYYFTPALSQSSQRYQLSSLLSSYAASLQPILVSHLNTSSGVVEAIELTDFGPNAFRVYIAVLPMLANTTIPLDIGPASYYRVYILANSTGLVSPGDASGWRLLPRNIVAPTDVYVYVRNNYYSLSSFGWNNSLVLYDAGLVKPSLANIFKIDVNITEPGLAYIASFFVSVSGKYYEIARIVLYGS